VLIVDPWCGQTLDSVMNVDALVRTIATGDPLMLVVATPPTVASDAKFDTLSVVLNESGAVDPPAAAHAASAAAAAAYALSVRNRRRSMMHPAHWLCVSAASVTSATSCP